MSDEELLEQMENEKGFFHHNHFHVIEANENNIEVKAMLDENSMNPYGIVHGGIIFGLGDTVMGMVAKSTGRKAITLDANINYFYPGKGSFLTAKAEMLKNGHTTCHLRAYIYDEDNRLIATMNSNYYYID